MDKFSAWKKMAKDAFQPMAVQADQRVEMNRARQAREMAGRGGQTAVGPSKDAPNLGSQLTEQEAQARFREYLRQQALKNAAEAGEPDPSLIEAQAQGYRLLNKR